MCILLLVACTAPSVSVTDPTELPTIIVFEDPSPDIAGSTVPKNITATDSPFPTELETEPTSPPYQATRPEIPATEVPTEPPAAEPTPTEPKPIEPPTTDPPATQPEETEPPATEPEKEAIDAAVIASYAKSYAASLGFVIDSSLGKGNAGYYPPDYRPLTTTQEGKNVAAGLVSATKNQINSRFTTERSDVLVEGAHGLVRMNCIVQYSHTNELGDWYYIYVFYG